MTTERRSTEWGAAKAQLIAAAQELLLEQFGGSRPRPEAVASALAFLAPASVAERAGVARSAFNHHWRQPVGEPDDGLTAFQRFVADVFEAELGDPIDDSTVAAEAVLDGSFLGLCQALVANELARYERPDAQAAWRSSIAIAMYGGADKDAATGLVSGIAAFYETLLVRFGRQTVAGVTVEHVAAAIMAHIDGVLVGQAYGLDAFRRDIERPDPDTGEPTMMSMAEVCISTLVEHLTEPIDN